MKKYLLYPGYVKSKTDGDVHFIKASDLARLYGVDLKECEVYKGPPDVVGRPRKLIELRPDYSGRYHLEGSYP